MCPWNVRFSTALPDESPYATREALAGRDARQLARDLLGMTRPEFSAALEGAPSKRAKLRGLERNAAVVPDNAGTADDVEPLTRALDAEESIVREHAAWALSQLGDRAPTTP